MQDEKYYEKLSIPRVIIRRIVMEMIGKNANKKISRIDKKALDILHYEIEKYISELFLVSGYMMDASKRNTVLSSLFKKAAKLHEVLHHTNRVC
jgi:histone H3/H4